MKGLFKMLKNQKGQGMVEYGLILALITVVAIVALTDIGKEVKTAFEEVLAKLQGA